MAHCGLSFPASLPQASWWSLEPFHKHLTSTQSLVLPKSAALPALLLPLRLLTSAMAPTPPRTRGHNLGQDSGSPSSWHLLPSLLILES